MRRAWTTLASALPTRLDELQRLDAVVRGPLPLSTRVGFAGVDTGVGCSTAAGLAASVLAARRSHRVLAVNASASRRSVLWHAGLTSPATTTAAQDLERRSVRTSAGATAGLPTTPAGLHCLDLVGEGAQPRDATWWEAVAPAGRFFDFVVTDLGARDAGTVASVVSASTLVCVVVRAERDSLQRGLDLAHAAGSAGVRAVMAVVDVDRRRTAAIGDMVRLLPLPAVEVVHDRAHRAVRPVPSTGLRAATNLAALRLAAALVETASPGRSRGRSPGSSSGRASNLAQPRSPRPPTGLSQRLAPGRGRAA
jgi:hypothetical protein